MKLVFAVVLIVWGVQLLLENLLGVYIPFFRLLVPLLIVFWGICLLRRPDWNFSYSPFSSQMTILNSQDTLFLHQLHHNQFIINSSNCTFDGTQAGLDKTVTVWVVAKKSKLLIRYNNAVHTILNISLNRSSVHSSTPIMHNIPLGDNHTMHLGKISEKPTVFFHIKAKDSLIEISEI